MIERLSAGTLPDKPHTALRGQGGALHYEECFTRRGFDGAYSILYHSQRPHISEPTATKHGFARPVAAKLDVLKRRHFRSDELDHKSAVSGGPVDTRIPLLFNRDVVVSVLKPSASDPVYFANSDGDDVFFVREGAGTLISPFGTLAFVAGDYVVIPRGLLHRFEIDAKQRQTWLSMECLGGVGIPAQHRNEAGQLRMDAPYSHRDFRGPVFSGPRDEELRSFVIKREGRFHGHTLANNPLDVVGWDGAVYPFVFPISRFSPRVGAVHLPPTLHGTFAARGALICSFVPRMLDFGANAIPCPYPHNSADVDEIIYYCDGQFSSRKDVGAGSLSLHPAGITHGPHKGAYEDSIGATRTEELAVMLDCFAPLSFTEQAISIEDSAYHTSF
jgi:homogentisate 1,2-dioxygenase